MDLSGNKTTTQKLINHACPLFRCIMWTHVTSPFVNKKMYEKIIEKYQKVLKIVLLMTTKIKRFLLVK